MARAELMAANCVRARPNPARISTGRTIFLELIQDMIKNGEITISEVKRIFRHYWWILPIAIVGCGGLGLLAATSLPKKYTSETLVLVDQPTVPTEFVKPVVTDDLNHRLASMQEQILSRTRLQPIIEKFGLYAEERRRKSIDDLVEKLRKCGYRDADGANARDAEPQPCRVSTSNVTFNNPQTAQQICTEITSMFMQQNTREREQQAVQTTSFLNEQLEEAKRKLDDQDREAGGFQAAVSRVLARRRTDKPEPVDRHELAARGERASVEPRAAG